MRGCDRVFISFAFAMLSGLVALGAEGRPNVLLIVADDLRADALGAYGNGVARTPVIDRLARSGVRFTRAVCSNPVCVPSRAEMLTGRSAFRALPPNGSGALDGRLPLWPAAMRAAGYHTWHVGKWHTTGTPHQRGYEATRGWFGDAASAGPARVQAFPVDHRGQAVTGYVGWVFKDDAGRVEPGQPVGLAPNISERFADAAIEWIERAEETPFFLHVNFAAPHDPRLVPRGYERSYRPEAMPLPRAFAADHPFDHGNAGGRDEVLLPRPLTPELIRAELAVYAALVEHMDAQIGRILEALDRSGRRGDTLVIFTSDNGLALGSHGLTGKQNMYEHTINVPLILSGAGVVAGGRTSPVECALRDLFPTVCAMCGIDPPADLDGKSFARVLKSAGATDARAFGIGYFLDAQRMIRGERWKLIRYPRIGREQLFDLANDPDELHDRIADKATAAVAAELRAELARRLAELGDPLQKHPPTR